MSPLWFQILGKGGQGLLRVSTGQGKVPEGSLLSPLWLRIRGGILSGRMGEEDLEQISPQGLRSKTQIGIAPRGQNRWGTGGRRR